ncbi:DUF397 domain-containing protein, partial [Kitasatospora sp. NPDC005856]|uniref:DUF397 domain-containing protein n=1 Tax=Kitasatospora sp. NPDC005856 TaxID=3154566 RepID=UPI0034058944
FSGNQGNCIEVADGFAGVVPVRDSKDPDGPAVFPRTPARGASGTGSGYFPHRPVNDPPLR